MSALAPLCAWFVDERGACRRFEFAQCVWDAMHARPIAGTAVAPPAVVHALFRDMGLCDVRLDADGTVVLTAATAAGGVWLSHAGCCPARALRASGDGRALGALDLAQVVRVGVAAVVEDASGRVLLTQRAASLR